MTTITTIEEFAEILAKRIAKDLETHHDGMVIKAQAQKVLKTNVERQGVTVRINDGAIAPTVYVEEYYAQYKAGTASLDEIASRLAESAYQASLDGPSMPDLTPEEARKHVTLNLINTAMNQERLNNTPHMSILGGELSAIPRWMISEEASFIVSNELASSMGLTSDEVIQMGKRNIDEQHFVAKSMRQIFAEMMDPEMEFMLPPNEGPEMIVLSSENKLHGANALLSESALNEVHEMLGSDYVILPSSIHEVICVPVTDDMDANALRAMVHEVNGTQVAPEERLSDEIFKYDGVKLTIVGESLKVDTDGPKVEMKHKYAVAM